MKGLLPVGSYQEWTVSTHFKSYCEDFGLQVLHAWFSFSEIWVAPQGGPCTVAHLPRTHVTCNFGYGSNCINLQFTRTELPALSFDAYRSTLRCTLLLSIVSCIAIKAQKIDLGNIIIWYAAVSMAASIWFPSGGPALLDLTSHHASIYMTKCPKL